MDHILEKVREIISEPMANIGITVDEVSWTKEKNYNYLIIILDKDTGLNIDEIVEATNIINPILDEYDLIKDEYILDISSKERG